MRWSASSVAASVLVIALGLPGLAQTVPSPQSAPAAATAEPPKDALGRDTPRGTVIAFLGAARRGDGELARQYLNTRLTGRPAEELAQQLFVVLNDRLPARLTQLSGLPEGSRGAAVSKGREVIGTIDGDTGPVDIVVERMERGAPGPIWLFSSTTLDAVPALYRQISSNRADARLVRMIFDARVGGIRLFDLLAFLLGLPLLYAAIALLNRFLTPVVRLAWGRLFKKDDLRERNALPLPARLLLLALLSRWLLPMLPSSLLLREFWANTATMITIVAVGWLLILLNGEVEASIRRRMPRSNTAAVSLLRVARRGVDVLVIFAALLVTLRNFGVDPTPALAGLGVGGIAVALAAQKTLENVIAGASLIFDQAVRVGDFLKMGDLSGTVDHIGLRSTRLRTLDRTVVSVPNSQIANASLETISARDKFWFHPVVGLAYEATADQVRAVVDGIRQMLEEHVAVDRQSVRVRFLRLGAFSLDVDVSAYLHARDWNHFLEIQEGFLFGITDIVSRAGATIAFPSQTMYVANQPQEQEQPARIARGEVPRAPLQGS